MYITAVGISHKTAPTCNRTEIYTHTIVPDAGGILFQALFRIKSIPFFHDQTKYFYVYKDSDAVCHLLRVASGLESVVFGENQILGQVKKTGFIIGFVFCFAFLGNSMVMADVEQIKLYKAAFPESKPKCTFCHVDKLPKKDKGMHEPNAYGKKVREAAEITADTYKQVGTFEDFEAQNQGVDNEHYDANVGMKWSPRKDLAISPHYGYYSYRANQSIDYGNYSAHVAWLDFSFDWF